jgi:hypothetical protein
MEPNEITEVLRVERRHFLSCAASGAVPSGFVPCERCRDYVRYMQRRQVRIVNAVFATVWMTLGFAAIGWCAWAVFHG